MSSTRDYLREMRKQRRKELTPLIFWYNSSSRYSDLDFGREMVARSVTHGPANIEGGLEGVVLQLAELHLSCEEKDRLCPWCSALSIGISLLNAKLEYDEGRA